MERRKRDATGGVDTNFIKALAGALRGSQEPGERVGGVSEASPLDFLYWPPEGDQGPQGTGFGSGVPGVLPIQGFRWDWKTPPTVGGRK